MGGLRRPELWAGPECAYLTVGDWECDQLVLTGHDERQDDIDRLAEVGVRAIRFPLIWGRDRGTGQATDWDWAAARIERMEALGVEPIVGLLHHGFGPAGSDPFDPVWPAAFAAYAGEVARRFPSVRTFLPINEPVTTARFSGLYGWWPPYGTDRSSFISLLLAQAEGYRRAVVAIRAARPDARIVANEDVGWAFGTARCRRLVDEHNVRRWLGWDLLSGRVERAHPFWPALTATAANRRIIDALCSEPMPPDLLGVDHYVTSDRFLDHRVERYPGNVRGRQGRLEYADVELVRAATDERGGMERAICDTWDRYGLPIALTEVALAGEWPDQVAWWTESWNAARDALRDGIPVAGVTAWAAFGAYDWNSCLREPRNSYEPGLFAVVDGVARETPLTAAVRAVALGRQRPRAAEGWWRREDRILYGAPDAEDADRAA